MNLFLHLKRNLSPQVQFEGKLPTTPAHKCSSAFLQTVPNTTSISHKILHLKTI